MLKRALERCTRGSVCETVVISAHLYRQVRLLHQ